MSREFKLHGRPAGYRTGSAGDTAPYPRGITRPLLKEQTRLGHLRGDIECQVNSREFRAQAMWRKLKEGKIPAESVEAVQREYAKEFAGFNRKPNLNHGDTEAQRGRKH